MIEKNKKIPVIPLFAGILILIHVVLIESVTPPAFDSGSMRYLLYWLMVSLSSIGTNLLALYVGYTMSSLSTPWRKLSKIAFYLVVLGLLSVLWGGITFKAFASSDLWILLLPISSNRFPFAASMLVLCLVGPFLIKVINHMGLE